MSNKAENNDILMFIHCGDCLDEVELIEGVSAKSYTSYHFGQTNSGYQLICKRHDKIILELNLPPQLMPSNKCKCGCCLEKKKLN